MFFSAQRLSPFFVVFFFRIWIITHTHTQIMCPKTALPEHTSHLIECLADKWMLSFVNIFFLIHTKTEQIHFDLCRGWELREFVSVSVYPCDQENDIFFSYYINFIIKYLYSNNSLLSCHHYWQMSFIFSFVQSFVGRRCEICESESLVHFCHLSSYSSLKKCSIIFLVFFFSCCSLFLIIIIMGKENTPKWISMRDLRNS